MQSPGTVFGRDFPEVYKKDTFWQECRARETLRPLQRFSLAVFVTGSAPENHRREAQTMSLWNKNFA